MEHLCPVAGNISWYRHYGIFYVDSSKKKKNLPQDSAIPLLGIYVFIWRNWNACAKGSMHSYVHCSILFFYNSQDMEPITQCLLIDKEIRNIWCIYICVCACVYVYIHTLKYFSAIKNVILPFVTTWMNLEYIMLADTSQTEKDTYHMNSLICGLSKAKQINIYN